MESTISERRAVLLGKLVAADQAYLLGGDGVDPAAVPPHSVLLGGYDPDIAGAIRAELAAVLGAQELADTGSPVTSAVRAEFVTERLRAAGAHTQDALWALLGGDDRTMDDEGAWPSSEDESRRRDGFWQRLVPPFVRARPYDRGRVWLVRQAAAALMNLIVVLVVAGAWVTCWLLPATPPTPPWSVLALKLFAVWCLSFLPSWLYVRFLGQRAGALWDEYVLNLHRLGWDEPRFLPRPPRTSVFYAEWVADGGRGEQQDRNIYRQKFNAYYGRSVADTARQDDFKVRLDALFPVFLFTAVLAVAWTSILWNDRFLSGPDDVWDVLKFGFLGAYVFVAQQLLRRFFASDLRPSTYTSALVRIAVVILSVPVVNQVLEIWLAESPDLRRWEAVAAFAIGFFPLVATQVVVRAASAPLRVSSRPLDSDYPLSQLDGLNIWYEARLIEENIDDMQNLSTANFVDVVLHTRVPVGRLVDWADQSFLLLHLDRVERGIRENRQARRQPNGSSSGSPECSDPDPLGAARIVGQSVKPSSRAGTWTRTGLRQLGVRTATDLLKAFSADEAGTEPGPAYAGLKAVHIDPEQIRTLVRVLSQEDGLAPVWNWHARGVPHRRCRRSTPTRPGD